MKYSKSIGIVFSYVAMLASCYFFDWSPLGVFFSFLAEIIIMLFVVAGLRIADERKHPHKYLKAPPVENYFTGAVPLILIQGLCIFWIASSIDTDDKPSWAYFQSKELITAVVLMLIFYILQARQIKGSTERFDVFRSNFLLSVVLLTVTNIAGMILVMYAELHSLIGVLSIMVAIRLGIELYFSRKMELL